MNRNEIPENLKWDIGLFKSIKDIDNAFDVLDELTNNVNKYYGKLNDKNMFFDYFNNHQHQFLKVQQLGYYIGNSLNTDNSNEELLKLSSKLTTKLAKYEKESAFVQPQLYELSDEYLQSLLFDIRAKNINNIINDIIKDKPHKLDEKTSQVIAEIGESFNNSEQVYETFTNSEMPFDDAVDSNGKSHIVTNAEFSKLLSSTDRKLRATAYNSTMNGYGKFNKTFSDLFISNLKAENDFSKLHKFQNLLSQQLEDEKVPEIVYKNNIKNVEKNIPILQEFVKTLANEKDLEDYAYYDLFEDEKISGEISIDTAHQIIIKALAPLGDDYISKVKAKLSDKSIDYMPNQNKRSGAYCSNCYNSKTLILMNWTNDYNSVSTLIHEMGHCINAEYFNQNQPIEKAEITIFAAEIASTVNEILLNLYMQQNTDKLQKKYYLKALLNDIRSTIYRQTLFSEFELFAHNSIENETAITYSDLNNCYYQLNKKYYGNSCVLPDNLKYEWSRIPHFYSPYYVFSYSTGLIAAIAITSKLITEKDFNKKYINFLKNGTDKPAIEILKEIGIDLTTDIPFKIAFDFISKTLNEYKSICK